MKAMKSPLTELHQGVFLISEPFLSDNYFKRSVVLLSEHDKSGTVGFILNKPTEVNINDAVEDFPDFEARLYFGGPVETDSLFYIHTIGKELEGAREISNGIFWGGSYDQLKTFIAIGKVHPGMIRFYAGYSGWDPNQLDTELAEKSWLVTNCTEQFTFYDDPKCLWSQVLRSMGQQYAMMANFPEDPALN
jgi:putative transcriptional regulator